MIILAFKIKFDNKYEQYDCLFGFLDNIFTDHQSMEWHLGSKTSILQSIWEPYIRKMVVFRIFEGSKELRFSYMDECDQFTLESFLKKVSEKLNLSSGNENRDFEQVRSCFDFDKMDFPYIDEELKQMDSDKPCKPNNNSFKDMIESAFDALREKNDMTPLLRLFIGLLHQRDKFYQTEAVQMESLRKFRDKVCGLYKTLPEKMYNQFSYLPEKDQVYKVLRKTSKHARYYNDYSFERYLNSRYATFPPKVNGREIVFTDIFDQRYNTQTILYTIPHQQLTKTIIAVLINWKFTRLEIKTICPNDYVEFQLIDTNKGPEMEENQKTKSNKQDILDKTRNKTKTKLAIERLDTHKLKNPYIERLRPRYLSITAFQINSFIMKKGFECRIRVHTIDIATLKTILTGESRSFDIEVCNLVATTDCEVKVSDECVKLAIREIQDISVYQKQPTSCAEKEVSESTELVSESQPDKSPLIPKFNSQMSIQKMIIPTGKQSASLENMQDLLEKDQNRKIVIWFFFSRPKKQISFEGYNLPDSRFIYRSAPSC